MRFSSTTVFIVLAAGAAAGCSRASSLSTVSRAQNAPITSPTRTTSSSETLLAAEILASNALSTPEAVRRLRPEFLRATVVWTPDAGSTRQYPSVYLNGVHAGGPDILETVPVGVIEEIRFVRAVEAKAWWGSLCPCSGGVISVRTKKEG
jgi:hypothetical protein